MALPLWGSQAFASFFLEFSVYISVQRSSTYGKGAEKPGPCALTNPPDEHDLYLKTAGKEGEMQTSTQQT